MRIVSKIYGLYIVLAQDRKKHNKKIQIKSTQADDNHKAGLPILWHLGSYTSKAVNESV
jgi:hypothetical protein